MTSPLSPSSSNAESLREMVLTRARSTFGRIASGNYDYAADRRSLEKLITVTESIQDVMLGGAIYNTLAVLHANEGCFQLAIDAFKAAEDVHRPHNDSYHVLTVQNNRGELERIRGHLDDARACFDDTIAHSHEFEDDAINAEVMAYCNRGFVHNQLCNYQDAESDFVKAISFSGRAMQTRQQVLLKCRIGLAEVHLYSTKNLDRAWESVLLARASAIAQKDGPALVMIAFKMQHLLEKSNDAQRAAVTDQLVDIDIALEALPNRALKAQALLAEAFYHDAHDNVAEMYQMAAHAQEFFSGAVCNEGINITQRLMAKAEARN